jgi:hypothetical protein
MKISYGLTAWVEHLELKRLLDFLAPRIDDKDEIVIVYDQNRATPEVLEVMNNFKREKLKNKNELLKKNYESTAKLIVQ